MDTLEILKALDEKCAQNENKESEGARERSLSFYQMVWCRLEFSHIKTEPVTYTIMYLSSTLRRRTLLTCTLSTCKTVPSNKNETAVFVKNKNGLG